LNVTSCLARPSTAASLYLAGRRLACRVLQLANGRYSGRCYMHSFLQVGKQKEVMRCLLLIIIIHPPRTRLSFMIRDRQEPILQNFIHDRQVSLHMRPPRSRGYRKVYWSLPRLTVSKVKNMRSHFRNLYDASSSSAPQSFTMFNVIDMVPSHQDELELWGWEMSNTWSMDKFLLRWEREMSIISSQTRVWHGVHNQRQQVSHQATIIYIR
jgi:hypothetical protein